MFFKLLGKNRLEISHKQMENPETSVYFNHIHNHCEILLFLRGEADYNIDGQLFRPSPYDMLFIPAGSYHYLIPTVSRPYENYVIGIEPSIMSEEQYTKLFSPPLMINIKDEPELIDFFKRLELYAEKYSDRDFEYCADLLIREMILYCSYRKNELHSIHSAGSTHIDRIVKLIADNIEEPLDAEIIAKHLLLSRSYVQNMFSQHMHIGLKKYIMQKKIYAAQKDLAMGMPPGEVCEKYSFGDYSGFYRLYKQTFSTPPRQKSN